MPKGPAPAAPASKTPVDYEAEDDLRTLSRSEEIRADQGRMKRVRAAHRRQSRSLKRVGAALGRQKSRR